MATATEEAAEATVETTEIPITRTLVPTGGKIKLFLQLKAQHTKFLWEIL